MHELLSYLIRRTNNGTKYRNSCNGGPLRIYAWSTEQRHSHEEMKVISAIRTLRNATLRKTRKPFRSNTTVEMVRKILARMHLRTNRRSYLVIIFNEPMYILVGHRSSYRPPVESARDRQPARPVNDAGSDHVDGGTASSLARWSPAVAGRPTSSLRLVLPLTVLVTCFRYTVTSQYDLATSRSVIG